MSSTHPIARLFAPRSIAIIGASADETKFSGRIMPYLLRNGYTGMLYPINARRSEILGRTCYPDLAAVPGEVDCVVYSIAAEGIDPVLEQCEAKRVKLLLVTSAGFAERGDAEGLARQARLLAFARRTGTRVLGPNCVGFLNPVDGVAMAAAVVLEFPDPPRGRIGLISQSGGIGMATVPFNAFEQRIGFSRIVNTGNEADLELAELTAFLADDPATDVIALMIEGVRDAPAFQAALERAAAANKPVLILKTGRSALGQAMAASHTAALAGSDAVFDAMCRRTGALRVDDIDELYRYGAMFSRLLGSGKLPQGRVRTPGRGVTGFSVSGGHVGLFGDLGAAAGLGFPDFAEATQSGLRADLQSSNPHFLNPLDLTGGAVSDHSVWGRALERLLADPAVQIAVPVLTVARNYDPALADIIRIAAATDKIVLALWVGGAMQGEGKAMLRNSDVPLFESPAAIVKGIGLLDHWCADQAERADRTVVPREPANLDAARRLVLAHGTGTLGERAAKDVLATLGFPVTRERLVDDAAAAVSAAGEMGYPVVAKGEHPDILHKTEAGIIHLDLRSADAVTSAHAAIMAAMARHAPGRPATGVLIQEQVPAGIELILGVKRDPVFGPVVLFGLGGIYAEVLRDVSLALAPLSHAQARSMMASTRGFALLSGARGRRPADLDRIAGLLVLLGDLAVAGVVDEVDVNPLIVIDRPVDALRVVDALIVPGGSLQPGSAKLHSKGE